jgi:hypothetical protein
MTTLETPSMETPNPSSPVPLDTIPISPADGHTGDENTNPDGSAPKKQYKDTDQITVFHDPDNFNVKHPLIHNWTLWFTKPPSGKVAFPKARREAVPMLTLDRVTTGMICSKKSSLSTQLRNFGAST